jgi:large subunit ribosomal protein L23
MSNQERLLQVLVSPSMTEKTSNIAGFNQYCFQVLSDANKLEIRMAIEKLFKVKVKSVNVLNRKGKRKTRGNIRGMQKAIRRAYVTLQEGHAINLIDQ